MTIMNTTIIVVVVMVAMASASLMAVEGNEKAAPAPVDCMSVVMLHMTDCLSYVKNGSTVDKPQEKCCLGLKYVLDYNPDCLCQAFTSSSQFAVVLNVSKALSLPNACHVHAPPVTKCLSPSPAGAPAGVVISPASAPSASSKAPSSSAGGSEVSPTVAPTNASSSSVIGISVELIMAGIVATLSFGF